MISLAMWVISWMVNMITMSTYYASGGAAHGPLVIGADGLPVGGMAMWWSTVPPSTWLLSLVVGLVLLWPGLAVGVKRCHDRGKSGWWLLLLFIPLIGFIWWLIDLGMLEGTPGPNAYGPSPKGLGGQTTAAPATIVS